MSNLAENSNEFLEMLEEYMPTSEKRVEGRIDKIERNYVYVDVPGQRTVVRVRTEELEGYNVGDSVEVIITGSLEEEGQEFIIASRRRIDLENNWNKIEQAFESKEILKGKITKKIKGGYLVEVLFHQGFLPNSLSEITEKEGINAVGKEIDVIVKDLKVEGKENKSKKITFSKKDITLLKEKEEFAALNVGDIVDCKVVDVMDFGIAVMVGHLRGFIHISEVSWKRLENIGEKFTKGEELKAVVISLDEEKKNVKLSIKRLSEDPWQTARDIYKEDDEITGTVSKILSYGAFVEIMEGVEGLVHVSDFTWNKKRVNIEDYAKAGDQVKVKIIEFDSEKRKLKLGFKQLFENPWENAEENYSVGKDFQGKVLDIKPFGMFVEIETGVDAFIHISDFAWQGEEDSKFEVGDTVNFKIVELNLTDKKIKGSIKALTKSPWDKALEEFKVGTTVEKKIKNIMDFGIFIELIKGVDGFIPTQFASKDFIKNLNDKFTVGDIVKAQIVDINKETQKIKLSIKKIELEEEKRENKELLEKYGTTGETEEQNESIEA